MLERTTPARDLPPADRDPSTATAISAATPTLTATETASPTATSRLPPPHPVRGRGSLPTTTAIPRSPPLHALRGRERGSRPRPPRSAPREGPRQLGMARPRPRDLDAAHRRSARDVAHADLEPVGRQGPGDAVGPFHQQRAIRPQEIEEPGGVELVAVGDAVEVGVVHGNAATVGGHDGEAGARHLLRRDGRPVARPPGQLRLPGPQIADERHHVPRSEEPPQPRPEREGGSRRAGAKARREGRRRHYRPHSTQTAPSASARSPARRPRSPQRLAARSPARP